jgi:hypothetical protein
LFFRYPALNPRRLPPKDTAKHDRTVWETCAAIKQAALIEQKPYVLPKRFQSRMTVTAKANAAPDGELIRAWLPIPRSYPFQTDFKLLRTSSTPKQMDDEQSPIRALHLEQPARRNKPTEFEIQYEYTMHGVWFDVKPEPSSRTANDSSLNFLGEAPHVVFTPKIRALSEQIAGDETNRKQARSFMRIADNIKPATRWNTRPFAISRLLPREKLRRLRSGGFIVHDTVPAQRHPRALAIRLEHIPRREDDSRLVRDLSRTLWLDPGGSLQGHLGDALRRHAHAGAKVRGEGFLFWRAGLLPHGREQRSQPGIDAENPFVPITWIFSAANSIGRQNIYFDQYCTTEIKEMNSR